MAEPVRVTIYDTQVDKLFQPGGNVWHTMGLIGMEHLNAAIMFAPRRSGHLAASHYPVAILTPYQKRGVRYTIRNDADYALYVHGGTVGPIHGWEGIGWMTVPPYRGAPFKVPMLEVSGQDANPWIQRAADYALAPFT